MQNIKIMLNRLIKNSLQTKITSSIKQNSGRNFIMQNIKIMLNGLLKLLQEKLV